VKQLRQSKTWFLQTVYDWVLIKKYIFQELKKSISMEIEKESVRDKRVWKGKENILTEMK